MTLRIKLILGFLLTTGIIVLISLVNAFYIKQVRDDLSEIGNSSLGEMTGASLIHINVLKINSNLRELLIEYKEQRPDEVGLSQNEIIDALDRLGEGIEVLSRSNRLGIELAETEEKEDERNEQKIIAETRLIIKEYDKLIRIFIKDLPVKGAAWADGFFEAEMEPLARRLEINTDWLIRDTLDEIGGEVQETNESIYRNLTLSLLASALGIALSLGIGLLVSRRMTRPIEALHRAMNRLRSGNEELHVEPPQGKDELVDLTRAFNQMVSELHNRTTSIDNLNREIAIRTEIEAALRDSEAKYRLLIENAEDAILIVQKEQIQFANPATYRILGYSKTELPHWIGNLVHPEDREMILGRHRKRIQGESIESSYVFRMISKTGKTKWVQITAVLMTWMDQPAVLAFIRDISVQKALEEQIQRSHKMEALGALAGGVAHDLNNILSGIVSYPELLLMDIPEESPLREPILSIKQSGEKAAAIVQDLLTLARRGVVTRIVTNLNSIVSECLKSPEYRQLKNDHPEANVRVDLEKHLLNLLGSPFHLSKVLMNLVSNALEAMPHGGNLTIITENAYIEKAQARAQTLEEGDYVVLRVVDDGTGMTAEEVERVFEPFYSKKEMGKSGTGLGMAVVWGTVKDHGGHIQIHSEPGKGTEITILFPITRKEISRENNLPALSDYAGNGEFILVVDDMAEQRELAQMILKKLRYNVVGVDGGEAAVDYLKNRPADLVILDMIMDPGMDGLDTYRAILEERPGQRAIIVSGFSETERVQEALALGAATYLKKPYLLDKLGMAVRSALDGGEGGEEVDA